MNAEHAANARVRRENASSALDGLQAEVARGDGHRPRRLWRSLFSLVFFLSTTDADTGTPSPSYAHGSRTGPSPAGWKPSKRVGRTEATVVRDSWKVRATMKTLVAAHGTEETVEAEQGHPTGRGERFGSRGAEAEAEEIVLFRSYNGKHISIPTFARALSPPSEVTFILLLQLIPLSLSDIAWHDRIDYDASLVHTNTPMEDEYTPDKINRDLLEPVMKHGKGVSRMRRTGCTRGSHAGKWPSPGPPSLPCFLSSSGPTPCSDVTRNPNSTPKYERGDPINIALHMDPGRNLLHEVEIELERRAHGGHQGERGNIGVGRSPSPG
ncbi:hypothetical protein FIBSPDRAFT_961977 [Athelia psychrophila]|uniref:Uncharacterized protein n=1 Tax=Athelia psychrophila TaxID=1759441 RepID=A0A166AP59_9AGAM|nr:hypothetical protein FIBSPDRAFT_961977 [Fibularhizoctonia sp. CBS 109695]